MAYALRYYKEITQKDGSVFRLEIHKKDSTASAVEIGAVVQGLSLEIQGQQGDVDTPIVKTSLSMTFVDAGDVEDGRKNGFWEEFYTPDALLWKVILKAKNATENTFRTVWGGYVTPDSYSESLVYRGSVNIIARDNIGHMQDFPFDASGDADGMISLYNLVNAGWEKIASPMSLSWGGEWLYCEGVPAYNTLMNVSAFEGKNWYEAVESALASYGLVMRYVGDNVVQASSLRYMPYQGKESMDLLPRIEPKFIAGAQRELVPAVRRIEESVDYDIASELQPLITADDYSGDTYQVIDADSNALPFLGFDLANKNIGGWSAVTENGSFFVDFSQYYFHTNVSDSDEEKIKKETYLIANVAQTLYQVEYTKTVNAGDMQIVLTFGRPIGAWREYDSNGRPLGNWFPGYSNGKVTSVVYGVAVTQNGITSYLQEDGEWGEESVELVHDEDGLVNLAIPVGLSEFSGVVDVTLFLYSVKATCAAIQLAALEFSPSENISYRAKNNVNTVYNAENNVILSRTPDFGPAFDRVTLPAFIKNGIFYRYGDAILPARAWAWSGGTPQQMAVYNHLQLLCYYAKPNNQISGTIVNADLTRARAIYEWHGKEHLLVSGRYDFLTGFIEGAVLREFIRYDDMWGEVSEALLPDTEENSKSNIEAGVGSGSSSSTYTNTTTVNIGSGGGGGASYLNDLLDVDVDGATVKSVLYFDGNTWIDKNVAAILDEVLQSAKAIAGWFKKDDNGDIYTEVNFYSKKTVASGGKGTAGSGSAGVGTVMAVSVNGTTYDSVDGIVTIPDYPTKVSQLDNDMSYATTVQLTADLRSKQDKITASNPLSATLISGLGSLAFKDSLTKSDVGLGNVTNLAASGYLTALSSNTTNVVSVTVGGTTKNITAATMKTSLGLGSLAYKSSLVASDIPDISGTYLPLSGGTLSGELIISPLNISGKQNGLCLHDRGAGSQESLYLKWTSSSYANGLTLCPNDNYSELILNNGANNTLIHSGNIGSQSVNYAASAGNAATATKLATARKIWGHAFDGTRDIASSLYFTNGAAVYYADTKGTNRIAMTLNDGDVFSVGFGTAIAGYNTEILGNNIFLKFGTSRNTGFILNSSGNVTIGSTDILGTSTTTKLYVDGGIRFAPRTIWGQSFDGTGNVSGNLVGSNFLIMDRATNPYLRLTDTSGTVYFQIVGGNAYMGSTSSASLMVDGDGNVGIGTTTPQYKLDVRGESLRLTNDSINSAIVRSGSFVLESTTTGGWARRFSISNNTVSKFEFGAFGEGSTLTYGYVGPTYDNPWVTFDSEKTLFRKNVTIPSGQKLTIGSATIEWDSTSGALKVTGNMYSTGTLASGGKGTAGAGNTGVLLTDWADLPSDTANQKLMSLSAYLGNQLRTNLSGTYTIWGRTFFENGKPVNVTSSPILSANGGLYAYNYAGVSTMLIYYLAASSYSEFILGSASAANSEITRLCGYPIAFHAGSRSTTAVAKITTSGLEMTSGKTIKIGDVTLSASSGKLYANGVAIN